MALGVLLVIGLIAGYHYVFTPKNFEKIVVSLFNSNSNGRLELTVTKSSLFRGFTFENVKIFSGEDFDKRTLLDVEKINLDYSLYGFFVGDFGIHEIGVYRPHIYLYHKHGIWNISTLFPPGEEEPEEEKEPETEESMSGFSLPVKIRTFLKVVLQDFVFVIDDLDNGDGDTLEVGLNNFHFRTYFLSKKVRHFEFSTAIHQIIDQFFVELNPNGPMQLYFKNNSARLENPVDLYWLVAYIGDKEIPEFLSKLNFGHSNIPVLYENRHVLPLHFRFNYRMFHDPAKDRLVIDHITLRFVDDTWINLAGVMEQISDPTKTNVKVSLDRSKIDLGTLYPYYRSITNDRTFRFRGTISLAPMYIDGPLDNLTLDGKINFHKLLLDHPSFYGNFNTLQLYYNLLMKFQNLTPEDKEKMVPNLHNAEIGWNGTFNNAKIGAKVEYTPESRILAKAFMYGFNPAPFTGDQINGKFDLTAEVSGKDIDHIDSKIHAASNYFHYYYDRGRSGVNKIEVDINSSVDISKDFAHYNVNTPVISLKLANSRNKTGLSLDSSVTAEYSEKGINGSYKITRLLTNLTNLNATLPESLQESSEFFRKQIKQNIIAKGNTDFQLRGDTLHLNHLTNILVPELQVDDIYLKTKIINEPDQVTIDSFNLTGLKDSLALKLDGYLKTGYEKVKDPRTGKSRTEEVYHPYLDIYGHFGKKEFSRIFMNNRIEGFMRLDARADDNIIKGKFEIDHFTFDNGEFTRVNNVNLDFPFKHDIKLKKQIDLSAAAKERLMKVFTEEQKNNFTIESIEIPNPTTKKAPMKIIYPEHNLPGISGHLFYKDNIFEMPMMQIYMLNGQVTVQDVVVNIGTGELSQIESRFFTQVKQVDLKKLIPEEKARSIKNGKISFDMLLTASRLDHWKENISGYFSVYEIGKVFAKQAVKVVMPDTTKATEFLIDQTIIIRKIDFKLNEGLAYVSIFYTKGVTGQVVGLAGNEIKQNRKPVAELLQDAAKEVDVYKIDSISDSYNTDPY